MIRALQWRCGTGRRVADFTGRPRWRPPPSHVPVRAAGGGSARDARPRSGSPTSTARRRSAAGPGRPAARLAVQLLGDQGSLDLRGALVDARGADLAVEVLQEVAAAQG